MTTRRRLLAACAAATSLPGCQSLLDTDPNARIAWLWFRNDQQEPKDVDVRIVDNGETVYRSRIALDGPDSTRFTPTATTNPGAYIVNVSGADRDLSVEAWTLVDRNHRCIGLRFAFLKNGELDWTHRAMRRCEP